MSTDNKLFKKVSIKVGLRFINTIYKPLIKYAKSLKKADSSVIKNYHDFLFTFRKISRSRDYFELSRFKTNNSYFNVVLINTCLLIKEYDSIYGLCVYDVLELIITKVIEKYNKLF